MDLPALVRELAAQRGAVRRRKGEFPESVLGLIQAGVPAWAVAREAWEYGKTLVDQQGTDELSRRWLARPLSRVTLLAPIPRPAKNIFCLGRNYAEHAEERGAEVPQHPVYFTKPSTTVVGPGADIVYHPATQELDYEVELAAVIGTAGRDIPREDALGYVFGYTIVNDVTARDLQKRHGQWFKGKSLDSFCPMGPALVTADEIPDPQKLAIQLRVNGRVRQSSNTAQMIFPVARCIEVLSIGMTLEPGDLIATGTPAGVGSATGELLKIGDRIEAEVEGIGVLANMVAAPR
jgi:2-keto-4-pentenoate hydratase/2-oxohepta-3-ene-1,7-dioic acid hydratase in catechol pathway